MPRSIRLFPLGVAVLVCALAALPALAQTARDQISIVGSSTVYPFATVVAERFGKTSNFKVPTIESTGSGGGFKLFCKGVGMANPDITNSSRRIKASEVQMCADNGVKEIVEVVIGFDGIVLANSLDAAPMRLTRKDIFLALARDVPNPDGSEAAVANPYTTWQDVNPKLPAIAIEVLGPPPTSGTRDAFVELAMEGGCKTFDWIASMKSSNASAYKSLCHTIREDGAYVEAGENDNLIVNKLSKNPDALGIFGYSFLEQNADVVQGSFIDGVAPDFEAIADGDYPVARPLYFYVKKAHVDKVPGIREYLEEFISDDASGEDGYLTYNGLIPLPTDMRAKIVADVKSLSPLQLAAN